MSEECPFNKQPVKDDNQGITTSKSSLVVTQQVTTVAFSCRTSSNNSLSYYAIPNLKHRFLNFVEVI